LLFHRRDFQRYQAGHVSQLEAQLKQAPSAADLDKAGKQGDELRAQLTHAAEQLKASQGRISQLESQLKQAPSAADLVGQGRRRKLTPVRFPPGRARLATTPYSTGSTPRAKTIGIVSPKSSRSLLTSLMAEEVPHLVRKPRVLAILPTAPVCHEELEAPISPKQQMTSEIARSRASAAG
jgi:hypothetical protein